MEILLGGRCHINRDTKTLARLLTEAEPLGINTRRMQNAVSKGMESWTLPWTVSHSLRVYSSACWPEIPGVPYLDRSITSFVNSSVGLYGLKPVSSSLVYLYEESEICIVAVLVGAYTIRLKFVKTFRFIENVGPMRLAAVVFVLKMSAFLVSNWDKSKEFWRNSMFNFLLHMHPHVTLDVLAGKQGAWNGKTRSFGIQL